MWLSDRSHIPIVPPHPPVIINHSPIISVSAERRHSLSSKTGGRPYHRASHRCRAQSTLTEGNTPSPKKWQPELCASGSPSRSRWGASPSRWTEGKARVKRQWVLPTRSWTRWSTWRIYLGDRRSLLTRRRRSSCWIFLTRFQCPTESEGARRRF